MHKIKTAKLSLKALLFLALTAFPAGPILTSQAHADAGEYSFKVLENDENPKISGGGVLTDKLLHFMRVTQIKTSDLCKQELSDLNSLQSELDAAKYGVSQGQVDIARDELSDQVDMTIKACGRDVQSTCRRLQNMTPIEIAEDKTIANKKEAIALCKALPLKP